MKQYILSMIIFLSLTPQLAISNDIDDFNECWSHFDIVSLELNIPCLKIGNSPNGLGATLAYDSSSNAFRVIRTTPIPSDPPPVSGGSIAINNMHFTGNSPIPLTLGEDGEFTFSLTESSGADVPLLSNGQSNVSIKLKFSRILADQYSMDGNILDFFSISWYDPWLNVLNLNQIRDIPGDSVLTGTMMFNTIGTSTPEDPLNGVFGSLTSVYDRTNSDGVASIYTYTD